MKFEIVAAYVVGVLLPLLETCRRGLGTWSVNFSTMFEDHVAGGLLLIGAWASHQHRPWGPLFLVVAWAYVTGMMSSSFWYQVEDTLRGSVGEPNNAIVVIVKFLLWGTCVTSLILSSRRVSREKV